jgi:thiosulfate/3-mercaptopyruvate sulfurtransferase
MLAPAARFATAMGAAGIGDDTFVVTYDDHHVPVACRVWWSLQVYGHERAAVLDGGITRWRAEGRPATTGEEPAPMPAVFTPCFQAARYATKDQVRAALAASAPPQVVDARMDSAWEAAGGHLPGAVRLTGLGFLTDGEVWMTPDEARSRIGAVVAGDRPTIAYCGGGVAATGTALAFRLAGLPDVAVYDGSWTEWVLDPSTPKEAH